MAAVGDLPDFIVAVAAALERQCHRGAIARPGAFAKARRHPSRFEIGE
jgi:hypothetical protein